MAQYVEAELQIVAFDAEDVITASPIEEEGRKRKHHAPGGCGAYCEIMEKIYVYKEI